MAAHFHTANAMRSVRMACMVVLALAVGFATAPAQVIRIEAQDGTNCIQAPPYSPITFYVLFEPGGNVPGFTGVEFRIAGLVDNPPWFINITPPPIIDICFLGCPIFGAGAIMGFPSCQTTTTTLFTVTGFVVGPLPEMEWVVVGHSQPSNPEFPCASARLCDVPLFTQLCVNGGVAYVNRPGCPIAVAPRTWSQVRALYAGGW